MKRALLFASFLYLSQSVAAQEPADALRYSYTLPSGTARQQAIGGAMGSLGGDISATFVNPAGLAFYRTGDAVLSMAYHAGKTRSQYLERKEKDKDGKFDIGTTGFVFGTGPDSKKNSHAFSIAFNATGNFRNDVLYRGLNKQSSFSQRFIEELAVANVKDSTAAYLFPFGPSLALNTYWLDPQKNGSGEITGFSTNSPIATGLVQEYKAAHRGGIYETAIGMAATAGEKLMVGGTIGIPYLYYNRQATFTEADATADTSNRFDAGKFSERLTSSGMGINLKLGIIYKPKEYWRLGLALHSPTFYGLTDDYEVEVTTDTERYHEIYTDYSKDYFEGDYKFKYLHVTPYRVIGSVSYVLREIQDVTKQRGFLTADVEYINYKASSYHPDEEEGVVMEPADKAYLKQLNKAINKAYKGAFNFRAGGELKFTTIMVRAGAAYLGNPYKEVNGGNGNKFLLSGGLGYRNKGRFIDLSYVHAFQRDHVAAYRLQNMDYPVARLKNETGNIMLTAGFKF